MIKNQEFNIAIFSDILKDCLNDISLHMREHIGIKHLITSKLSFEKWFQVELLARLVGNTQKYPDLSWHNEIAVSQKTGKKGDTIDIGLKILGQKYLGIELKVVPSNYQIDGFEVKTSPITDKINEVISDLNKCKEDGYPNQISIALVFPLPIDLNHRNHADFNKQVRKMGQHGNVEFLECDISRTYLMRFYLLSSFEITRIETNR